MVETHEEEAIRALPEGPALTEALRKRFAPRAEAAVRRAAAGSSKGSQAQQKKYREEGVDVSALMHAGRGNFGRGQKPKGDKRAPNNNYPQYVFKRIEHGIAKATNITSWMKYEVSKKKKKNKKKRRK